ncbi:hypothetical protein [Flagellimonas sp. CMM7]|uniref:hypothetical protein n=1 Tax=Flagellimonas sp. CMM7 TaxID=2654676 RepID=UPI0013D2CCC1|nr:hypothetical protein [Flagellimonas sp. CMM7]UII79903.1 hypothetical protein LV704_19870 [Flagellimonas sp. CMM7]
MRIKSIKLFLLIILALFIADRAVFFTLHTIEGDVYTGQSVGKANLFNKVKDSVDLLVLGSSRAARHVDPGVFSTAGYNMGMDGTHFGYSAALISTLIKGEQIILVHIDHHELYDQSYEGEDMLSLINEITDSESLLGFMDEYYPEEIFLSKISKCYVYNGKVLGMLKNAVIGGTSMKKTHGFAPLEPSELQKKTFQKILDKEGIQKKTDILEPYEFNRRLIGFIDFAVEKAKNNHSKLIFFTSPSLNKVDNSIRERTSEFFKSKDALYLDNLDFFKDFNIDYWKDRTHMSKSGAQIYSLSLRDSIRMLMN